MPTWGLPALSWLISLFFFFGFVFGVGFPPDRDLRSADALQVFLWLFFMFLPFFSKVKIGGLLELQREVQRSKEELREFKTEVRASMSVLSTNVNTIGGLSNHVVVNLPGLAELQYARESLQEKSPKDTKATAKSLEEALLFESEDKTLALARTRIEIERHLRRILERSMRVALGYNDRTKLMSAPRLFEQFLSSYQDLEYLRQPFRYVMQICNAAIHAQIVPAEQADEALGLGAQIIAVLETLPRDGTAAEA